MTATADLRTFVGAAPESDKLLSFRRDIFLNRLFALLAGQADLRVGGLQGSDSVSTQHPPLKPLPDPIPLKIRFPSSNGLVDPGETQPDAADSDKDGTNDGAEVRTGTDPLNPVSFFKATP